MSSINTAYEIIGDDALVLIEELKLSMKDRKYADRMDDLILDVESSISMMVYASFLDIVDARIMKDDEMEEQATDVCHNWMFMAFNLGCYASDLAMEKRNDH